VTDPAGNLVAAARSGDRAALEELLRTHHDRLYALARRITGNDADAADATQEALIAIVRGLPRFDGRSSFGTWAYRVTANACLDELRRRRRRPLLDLPDERADRTDTGVALDTSDEALRAALKAGPWLIKPNTEELAEVLGCEVVSVSAQATAAPPA
jgi:RNA polymerase sigma-70 factor (ECF subfamily)